MVFDWFRRKFDQSAPKADTPPETVASPLEAAEPRAEEEVTESTPESAPAAAPEDEYLAWAKAAYQNLKKQQVADRESPSEPAPEPESPETSESSKDGEETIGLITSDADTGIPNTGIPNTGIPNTGIPNTAIPNTAIADTAIPNTGIPNTAIADTGIPNTGIPNTAIPNTGIPNTAIPNTAIPNTGIPNTGIPNTAIADTAIPNTAIPNTGIPNTTIADTAIADTGIADTGIPNTGIADTGIPNTAIPNTAIADTGIPNTAIADTGIPNTAIADTGIPNTAIADTAIADTAIPNTGIPNTAIAVKSKPLEPENRECLDPTQPEPPDKPRSLLDRGAADRQARLAQLKAEALAAEPDQSPEPAQTAPQPKPTIVFDEEFLWSAEVLAKEGRQPDQVSMEEINWLSRLRQGLDKTRRGVINQLKATIGRGPLDEDAVLTLESLLLQSDVGVKATDYIIQSLQTKLRQESLPPEQAVDYLKEIVRTLLDRPLAAQGNPVLAPEHDRLNIWLVTGVNGAGKTTTIGKLAHLAQKSGYRCLIAAADTFRAAAVQQVQVWGERTGVEVIANPSKNTDPAAVVFDALAAAQSRNTELLLIDTAGRLQNKKNLMAELSKIRKTIDKKADNAIVESLLVLDATLGQNGLRQAEVFGEAADLTGVVLTKLDGTAKGGVALGVVEQLNLPIRFVGAGEKITDLRPFSSYEFVEALLNG